jgi:hypothetical protein
MNWKTKKEKTCLIIELRREFGFEHLIFIWGKLGADSSRLIETSHFNFQ